jgi:(1->4)-alpha-D-glucan 1-alpha-D-glucosylmutase
MSASFFDFIGSVLLLEDPEGLSEEDKQVRRQFVLKFQQVTGPVTAKGLEDTAFYRYYPLASLNEVGGEPATPGTSVEHFHRRVQEQAASWPNTMVTTGTHDTKRGEDLRARLNVLSEVPEQWGACLSRWQELNASARAELDGGPVPDANEEDLIYQTLVGSWPLEAYEETAWAAYVHRIVQYLDKALREAKLHTSWTNPYEEYDSAAAQFVRTILADSQLPFVQEVDRFAREIASAGFTNSLAQTLVKLCVPGVPDFYQGVEFWDFNLVDPDNRRPVDFRSRQQALSDLIAQSKRGIPALAASLLQRWPDGQVKLYVVWRTLQLQREREELLHGEYLPLEVEGPRQGNVCAFARVRNNQWTLCVVPRFTIEAWRSAQASAAKQTGPRWLPASWWKDTFVKLPASSPANVLHRLSEQSLNSVPAEGGGHQLEVSTILQSFPVMLATGESK